jgi:hypothetical protein
MFIDKYDFAMPDQVDEVMSGSERKASARHPKFLSPKKKKTCSFYIVFLLWMNLMNTSHKELYVGRTNLL